MALRFWNPHHCFFGWWQDWRCWRWPSPSLDLGGFGFPEFTTAPFRFATQDCTGILLPLFLITDVWVVYIWRRMLDRRILMIMCGFGLLGQLLGWILFDYLSDRLLTSLIGLIAMITVLNYGWRRIRPGKRTSAEIAALVTQTIWQRGFVWFGLQGCLVLYRFPVGFLSRCFCYPMA